jgi:uncharacterized peroxidase-related enzyme
VKTQPRRRARHRSVGVPSARGDRLRERTLQEIPMPRLPLVNPETAVGKVKDLFQGPLKGLHFNLFKSLANSPAALEAYVGMHTSLGHAQLNVREREAVQLAIAERNGCGYCVAAHTAIGQSLGLSPEQTVQARTGHLADGKLEALVTFARSVSDKKGKVSDGDVHAFKAAGYEDAHVAEVVANIALAVFTNYFNVLNGTVVDFPAPPGA